MIKIKHIISIVVVLIAISTCIQLLSIRKEYKRMKSNQETLLDTVSMFKFRDSLNAAQVNSLKLKISEFKKHKQEDLSIIKDLKLKASQLENIVSINAKTITNLKAALRDTIIKDTTINIIDTLKYFSYKSKFTDVFGLIAKDSTYINIENREYLKAVQYKQKKKFWFIKLPIWLFGYKNKGIKVISMNPNTTVESVEYTTILE